MEMAYVILTLLRIVVPFTMLRWPLIGVIASAYLDYRDWDFLGVETNSEMIFYQNWDKILDTYYLAIAWYTSRFWKDAVARLTSSFLFFYRMLGVIIVLMSDRSLLLFFPNIFEWFFVYYLLFIRITKNDIVFTSKKLLNIALLSVAIPKLAQEYFMHVLRKPPWEVFDIIKAIGIKPLLPTLIDWNYWLWIIIFASLPFITLRYSIRHRNKL